MVPLEANSLSYFSRDGNTVLGHAIAEHTLVNPFRLVTVSFQGFEGQGHYSKQVLGRAVMDLLLSVPETLGRNVLAGWLALKLDRACHGYQSRPAQK